LTAAQISPPDIQLYTGLGSAEEAAYYMNRAGGLQGIIDALVETQTEGGRVVFDELRLEPYTKGKQRRRGAVNILSYGLQMTMNLENLISFIYHLQEQDGYYFLEQLAIKPGMSRAGTQTPLDVNATVNTLLVFKSEEKKAVKRAAAETTKQRAASKVSGGRVGGLVGLAMGMRRTIEAEKEAEKNKKWYEFWK
jgi:hypothetical protein